MPPHPLLENARALARSLAPAAAEVEQHGVTREVLDRLAAAGLYGLLGPAWAGGSEVPAAVYREVAETLAGADGNTWLVWFQHHAVVKMLAASENQELVRHHLPALCSGDERGGIAYSHLRNPSPSITAERANGVWRLRGTQPWCTGWGLIDVVLAGARTLDGDVVFALVPAREGPGLRPSPDLPLAAMAGTRTVALGFEDLAVPEEDVVQRLPLADWAAADTARAANVQPSVFGIASAALEALRGRDPATAEPLAAALGDVRAHAYRLADEVPPAEALQERLAVAARARLLCVHITAALVTGEGGRGMVLSSPAQRWAREALFHLVFAQHDPLRAATLEAAAELAPLQARI